MGWARTLLARYGERVAARQGVAAGPAAEAPAPLLLDANTRTFWSHGALAPATLVETGGGAGSEGPAAGMISALVATGGRASPPGSLPRANPAFSEAVFVELMRARQYQRAFQLLSADCQQSWGSPEAFAAQNRAGALSHLLGVDIKDVRYLDEWTDPHHHTTHRGVAELDVEYALEDGGRTAVVARTIHMVAAGGQWRSVCYPQGSSGH